MSRIAGTAGRRTPLSPDPLLAGLRALPAWRTVRVGGPRAALVWTGARDGGAFDGADVSVVLDGTLYNADEIDAALGGAPAGGDPARIAALYRRHGFPGALAALNGDFAVALHDHGTGATWLGRDRFGMKPLYHLPAGAGHAFASRPGALLALPGVPRAANRHWVGIYAGSHYRYIDNRPAESPYAAVSQLPAGHWLRIDADGATDGGRYWSLADAPDLEGSEADLAARYRDLLLDSVRRRVTGAERPAFTLSGGLDSSSVLSCAVAATGRRQHAYSSVYVDPLYDERDEIRSMLDEKVEVWHPVELGEIDVFEILPGMLAEHDEPVATATWLSHRLLVDRVAGDGFATLFGGMGGDEMNAGEYEYFTYFFADLLASGDVAGFEAEAAAWARHHDHPIWRKDVAVARANVARLCDPSGRIRPDRTRLGRYAAALRPGFVDLAGFEPEMDHPFRSLLRNRTFQDLFREATPCCLRAEDRHATAAGLARRNPFYDHRIAEFMYRVPVRSQIRDGVTKRLLRAAMRGILPEETRTRVKKTGWNAPAHLWFGVGRGAERLGDLIASRRFRDRGIYDPAEVDRLFADHLATLSDPTPRESHMMFFWQLTNLELWLDATGLSV